MSNQEKVTFSEPQKNILSYEQVTAAPLLLQTIQLKNLKLRPDVFSQPLYRDTVLHRAQEDNGVVGVNQVLRKNVYYLATLTDNVSDDVIEQICHHEILTEEERNEILKQTTTKLRSVKMFAFLVEKDDPDNSLLETFILILKDNKNEKVVELLERFCLIPDQNRYNPNNPIDAEITFYDASSDEDVEQDYPNNGAHEGVADVDADGRWSCKLCTFYNSPDKNECEVCMNIQFDELEINQRATLTCRQCTFVNLPGSVRCEVCSVRLARF